MDAADTRAAFGAAASWYLSVLDRVPAGAWDGPGLGEWTVRELAAHTARAFTTVETYLAQAPGEVVIADPVAYFQAAAAIPGAHEAVAERGRQEAAHLGAEPVAAITAIADRAQVIVDATADGAVCASPIGGIGFSDYLATRVLELVVHTSDLCAALGFDDQPPAEAAAGALSVLAGLAAAHPRRADVLRALTGRAGYPAGLTVLM